MALRASLFFDIWADSLILKPGASLGIKPQEAK